MRPRPDGWLFAEPGGTDEGSMRKWDVARRMTWRVRVRWGTGRGGAMGLGLLVVMTLLAGGGFLVGVGRPVRPTLLSPLWPAGLLGVA